MSLKISSNSEKAYQLIPVFGGLIDCVFHARKWYKMKPEHAFEREEVLSKHDHAVRAVAELCTLGLASIGFALYDFYKESKGENWLTRLCKF